MESSNAIIVIGDPERAIYARLADGEVLRGEEVTMLGHELLSALRARAQRNQRQLVEEADTLRLTAPS